MVLSLIHILREEFSQERDGETFGSGGPLGGRDTPGSGAALSSAKSPERGKSATSADTRESGGEDVFCGVIGFDGGLKNQINQAKAAVLYPPSGLNTLIIGASGSGKKMCIRDRANVNLTVEHAYKVGRFLGWYYGQKKPEERCQIVIGKDTRRSSYMFEYSLVAGLTASGADVFLLHVTTTPSVSYEMCIRDSLRPVSGRISAVMHPMEHGI